MASQAMNNANEKLCLKWNEFQDIAISAFGTLREDKDFADVTLACEDGLQVEAHKVILASSSPFFLDILKRNKHPHPLIYMCGLTFENLVPMMDFLYYGEANVYQENLDSFLAVAQELQLKGLMGSGAEEEAEENIKQAVAKKKTLKQVQPKPYFPPEAPAHDLFNQVDKFEPEPHLEGTVAVTDYIVAADLQDLDDKIKSMMETTEKTIIASGKNRKIMKCKACGKEGIMDHLRKHMEANHITGVSHSCNICGKISRSRNGLATHKSKDHKEIN